MPEPEIGRGSGSVELKEGVENRDEGKRVDGWVFCGGEGDDKVSMLISRLSFDSHFLQSRGSQ